MHSAAFQVKGKKAYNVSKAIRAKIVRKRVVYLEDISHDLKLKYTAGTLTVAYSFDNYNPCIINYDFGPNDKFLLSEFVHSGGKFLKMNKNVMRKGAIISNGEMVPFMGRAKLYSKNKWKNPILEYEPDEETRDEGVRFNLINGYN